MFQAVQLCSELVLCPGGERGERVQPPVLRVRRPQRHAVQGRPRYRGRGPGGRQQRGRGQGAGPRAGVHRPHQQQGLRQAVRQWRYISKIK